MDPMILHSQRKEIAIMKFVAPEMEVKMFSTMDILTDSKETTTEEFVADCPAELPMVWD